MPRWNTPLKQLRFVAFDVETTGLYAGVHEIVELAMVKFDLDGQEYGRFQTLVQPKADIPEELTKIHGITTEMARGGVTLPDALSMMLSFSGSWMDTLLVAHNAPFDVGFLTAALEEYGNTTYHVAVDTLSLARSNMMHLRPANHKLGTVANLLGVIPEGAAHRALADTVMCKDIFLKLMTPWRNSDTATPEGVNGLAGAYRFGTPQFVTARNMLAAL